MTYQKSLHLESSFFFLTDVRTYQEAHCAKSMSLTNFIDTILSIGPFDKTFIIIEGVLQ